MEVFLLNVMGSAALASAVIAGIMTTRLSREISGCTDSHLDAGRGERENDWLDRKP
jgi:hypothetical protein